MSPINWLPSKLIGIFSYKPYMTEGQSWAWSSPASYVHPCMTGWTSALSARSVCTLVAPWDNTRHSLRLKLSKPQAACSARQNFSVQAMNDWNGLPEAVVNAPSPNTFQKRTGHSLRLHGSWSGTPFPTQTEFVKNLRAWSERALQAHLPLNPDDLIGNCSPLENMYLIFNYFLNRILS